MSQMDRDHSRLVVIEKNKINSFKQEKFSSVKSEDGLFLYISLRLIQNYSSLVYNDFFPDFQMMPIIMGFFPLYFIPFFHLSSPRVDQIANLFDTCPICTFLKSLEVAVRLKVIVQVSLLNVATGLDAKHSMRWQQLSSQIFSNSLIYFSQTYIELQFFSVQ